MIQILISMMAIAAGLWSGYAEGSPFLVQLIRLDPAQPQREFYVSQVCMNGSHEFYFNAVEFEGQLDYLQVIEELRQRCPDLEPLSVPYASEYIGYDRIYGARYGEWLSRVMFDTYKTCSFEIKAGHQSFIIHMEDQSSLPCF